MHHFTYCLYICETFSTKKTFETDSDVLSNDNNGLLRGVRSVQCSNVAHKKPDVQNLFGIVQGGLDPVLR